MAHAGLRKGEAAGPGVPRGRGNVPKSGDVPMTFRRKKAGFTPGKSRFRNIRNIRNFLRGWGGYLQQHTTFPPQGRPLGSARRPLLWLAWAVGWVFLLVLLPRAAGELALPGVPPPSDENGPCRADGLICCVNSWTPGTPGQCSERSECSDGVLRSCLNRAVSASEHWPRSVGTSEHPTSWGLSFDALTNADDSETGRPAR
jgi:hypothetical protein